jgi:hypothetical protein
VDAAEGEVERRDYGRDIHLRERGRERGRVRDNRGSRREIEPRTRTEGEAERRVERRDYGRGIHLRGRGRGRGRECRSADGLQNLPVAQRVTIPCLAKTNFSKVSTL